MKNEKFQMIFGLRYTRGTADPFTITILKTMKRWKISNDFWVEVHAGYSWSLHDHQPKNHEKWKISNDFWVEVHAGDSWSLHDHHPENDENWKIFSEFLSWGTRVWDNWSLQDHQPKNHEKWKISEWFLGWGTRGVQLIPSRSPA